MAIENRERQIKLLQHCRYERALEIGCGGGHFTRMFATLADYITAIEVARSAMARARAAGAGAGQIDFRLENVMDHDFMGDRPWDLIVMNETIYYFGWPYSSFDVCAA